MGKGSYPIPVSSPLFYQKGAYTGCQSLGMILGIFSFCRFLSVILHVFFVYIRHKILLRNRQNEKIPSSYFDFEIHFLRPWL